MGEVKFRTLRADEIDVRVAMVKENGVSLLLYKDARVDQSILDETFGVFGWQRHHQLIGDNLYCTVSVWDADGGRWIEKQDVGVESKTEREKGQASDSFKRACFNLGIGRELYSAPFIWLTPDKVTIKDGKTNDHFSVVSIGYDENRWINQLTIQNDKTGKQVYHLSGGKPAPAEATKAKSAAKETAKEAEADPSLAAVNQLTGAKITKETADQIRGALAKYGKEEKHVCACYNIQTLEEMTTAQYRHFRDHWNEFKKRNDEAARWS